MGQVWVNSSATSHWNWKWLEDGTRVVLGFGNVSIWTLSVTDLRGRRKGRAPSGPKFLHFHAVFGKNWPNNRLAPPFGLSAPSSGKSWICHWLCLFFTAQKKFLEALYHWKQLQFSSDKHLNSSNFVVSSDNGTNGKVSEKAQLWKLVMLERFLLMVEFF